MKTETITTKNAPAAIGPYSQAIRVDHMVYTAGQIAIDPATGELVPGDIAAQTEQVLQNLQAVLTAAGSGLEHVVKTTIFLRYMKDFAVVNEVYSRYFNAHKPARSTVAVAALPLRALVEIEAAALIPPPAAAPAADLMTQPAVSAKKKTAIKNIKKKKEKKGKKKKAKK